MKVMILYGGKSGEHEVSLRSAASIVRNFDLEKHSLTLVGIDKDGVFWLQGDSVLTACRTGNDPLTLEKKEGSLVSMRFSDGFGVSGAKIDADIVFPVLHGTFGEDGTVQALIELAGLPYVGAAVLGSAIGMDKEITKIIWKAAGLPVVPWITAHKRDFQSIACREELSETAKKEFGFPVFVKPACAGSSVGAAKAIDSGSMMTALDAAFQFDTKALIEPYIPAREIECSVTGHASIRAYTLGEILPTHEFYDYDAKYLDPNGAALKIPADLSDAQAFLIRDIAVKAFKAVELSGYARVDFFIDKRNGTMYLNEVNTIPGFTTISMFPKMCEASGLPFPALIDHLVDLGMERWNERKTLQFSL